MKLSHLHEGGQKFVIKLISIPHRQDELTTFHYYKAAGSRISYVQDPADATHFDSMQQAKKRLVRIKKWSNIEGGIHTYIFRVIPYKAPTL
jgi:hypothetical protein